MSSVAASRSTSGQADGQRFADADAGAEHEPAQVREVLVLGGLVGVELSEPRPALVRGQRARDLAPALGDAGQVAHGVGADRTVAHRDAEDSGEHRARELRRSTTALGLHGCDEGVEDRDGGRTDPQRADAGQPCEVVLTAPDREWMQNFVRDLVTDHLAAGAHVDLIDSTYRWAGTVNHAIEARAVLHTRSGHVPAIAERVRDRHPYEVGCVASTPLASGEPTYLEWIMTRKP